MSKPTNKSHKEAVNMAKNENKAPQQAPKAAPKIELKSTSKSGMVRELYAQGMPIKDIAKTVGIRYQFAYNVVQRMEDRKARVELEGMKSKAK